MSLRSAEIALLAAELAPLAGSRVDGVRVHGERSLTLELRGPAGDVAVLVSAEPGLARLHVATWRPPPPEEPLPFQAVLRRELSGARL
ncbi:MAG TPA: NFACT family protein, partial [Anaeromyxobacteraceae bacterium]|nr:NFACT family protein [Anaeromyxobacteraceae bacterium]